MTTYNADVLSTYFDIVLDEDGFASMPSSSNKKVHIRRSHNRPYKPLCETEEKDPHFILRIQQAKTHPRICPECAAHPDLPLLLLGDL